MVVHSSHHGSFKRIPDQLKRQTHRNLTALPTVEYTRRQDRETSNHENGPKWQHQLRDI